MISCFFLSFGRATLERKPMALAFDTIASKDCPTKKEKVRSQGVSLLHSPSYLKTSGFSSID